MPRQTKRKTCAVRRVAPVRLAKRFLIVEPANVEHGIKETTEFRDEEKARSRRRYADKDHAVLVPATPLLAEAGESMLYFG